jgi:CRP-like cAMP-binding protein
MMLVLHDREHLRAVNSPYSRVLDKIPAEPFQHPSVLWFNRTYKSDIAQSNARRDRDSVFWQTLLAKLQSNAMGKGSILAGLSTDDIKKLTREGTILKARAGEALIRETDDDGTMFMIMSGAASAHLNASDLVLAEYGPGETFGEIALVTEAPAAPTSPW